VLISGINDPILFTRANQSPVGHTRHQESDTTRIYVPTGLTLRSQAGGALLQCEMYVRGHMVNLQ
jgi:hypothetical protein